MRDKRLIPLIAVATLVACATTRAGSPTTTACPPRPQTAALQAELRRVAADTALRSQLGRLMADTMRFAELRRMVEDPSTTAELRRLLADTTRIGITRPHLEALERDVARLSACWRD